MFTSQIVDICQQTLGNPYKLGTNDCNILVLKILDLLAGTDYVGIAKYDTLRKGKNQLKKLNVGSTFELIQPYIDEVEIEFPIPGDIWIDNEDIFTMSVYVSGRILVVNEEHTEFKLDFPMDGKFYRIKRSNNG